MNAASDQMLAEHAMLAWCQAMTDTVKHADLDCQMDLVSKRVKVYGIPGKDVIEYRDWKARRKYEFDNAILLALNFQKIRLISSTQRRIRLSATETTIANDGKLLVLSKNIILEHEDDGVWRVVEENITDWQIKNLDLSKY